MRTYLTLLLFISIAVASFWFLMDISDNQFTSKQTDNHFPDYFMDNFTITSMNSQGKPEYILKAKKMFHYADDNSAELKQVYLGLFKESAEITLNAERATFIEKEGTVYLYDNIILHRAPSATQSELSIYTDYLKIDSNSHIAETDKAARVVTGKAELNTIGLVFDNLKGTLLLKSQVKGIYETAD